MANILRFWILMIFATLICPIVAQETSAREKFEQYREQHRSQFNTYRQTRQAEFDQMRKERNIAFAKKLESYWALFTKQQPVEPVKEAPIPPIIYDEPAPSPQPLNLPIEEQPIVAPAPEPQPEPLVPIAPIEEQQVVPVIVNYFGTQIKVDFPKIDTFRLAGVSDKDIVQAWNTLMSNEYDVCIVTALAERNRLNLCDWAYIQMLDSVCTKRYGTNSNEAEMMLGYILVQTGYQLRFAHSSNHLYILIASNNIIYNWSYFEAEGIFYYPIHDTEESIYISEASFDTEKPLSLQIKNEQVFSYCASDVRVLTSTKKMAIHTCVNKNVVDFYSAYPMGALNEDFGTKWVVYANTPLEQRIQESIYPQIQSAIEGIPEKDAIDKILNWVQTAFVYEYDDKVWGGDRPFFATETLYYPYCDCEDRSILFSRIVRDVLNLDVVLLYYPGHLATAVHFNENVEGDFIQYNGDKYIVCDPTYIGAPLGESMPGMDNQTAKVIILK